MKTLVLRIYLALLAVLTLFALAAGAVVKWQFEREREATLRLVQERLAPWADYAQSALPEASAPPEAQEAALEEFARRWRAGLALEDAEGRRVAASSGFARREREWRQRFEPGEPREAAQALARAVVRLSLPDGRTLLVWRGRPWRMGAGVDDDGAHGPGHGPQTMGPGPGGPDLPGSGRSAGAGDAGPPAAWRGPAAGPWGPPAPPFGWILGPGALVLGLGGLFVAVAAGAWPVARRLTRRIETLQRGVEAFGSGQLQQRVAIEGRDEVSALARSFNQAAERIEALVAANRSLLANASHEIRSPLARLKMAVSMLDQPGAGATADPVARARRERLRAEVDANVAELDALVEEVLLASRLEARPGLEAPTDVDLVALVADEVARVPAAPGFTLRWAAPEGAAVVRGEERLLRRAVRNLLENARRYGGDSAQVGLDRTPRGAAPGDGPATVSVVVDDQGPGVPLEHRDRVFEPFFRLPGHAEHHGGVGLGLSLVRQIARRHGGTATCHAGPQGRGSRFEICLPVAP